MKKSILYFSVIVLLAFLQRADTSVKAIPVSEDIAAVSGNNAVDVYGLTKEIIQLQVPENIDFVVDPWGVAGQGQVYSGKYAIRNCGTQEGMLYLSNIVCFQGDAANVVVTEDKQGISKGEEKSVYIEIVFDDGETLVLSQKEQEYCIRLAPNEEIVFWINGAVNSGMTDSWKNNDVKISMTYRFCVG